MRSNDFKQENINYLDRVRQKDGVGKLKDFFDRLIKNNKEKGLDFINSGNLQFPTLFALQSEIKKNHLFTHLSQRNKLALEITDRMLLEDTSGSERLAQLKNRQNYPVLKWMLQTGYSFDGLNVHYDGLLINCNTA
jgi:hypothetical protein